MILGHIAWTTVDIYRKQQHVDWVTIKVKTLRRGNDLSFVLGLAN